MEKTRSSTEDHAKRQGWYETGEDGVGVGGWGRGGGGRSGGGGGGGDGERGVPEG